MTKLTVFLIAAFSLQVSANAVAQKVSLHVQNQSLERIMKELGVQSGYSFIYDHQYLSQAKQLTLEVKEMEISEVLPMIFANQPFDYRVRDKIVTLIPKATISNTDPTASRLVATYSEVGGRVLDSLGNPLPGVTVRVLKTNIQTVTNQQGQFILKNVPAEAQVEVYMLGYVRQTKTVSPTLVFRLIQTEESIGEVVVTGLFERKAESFTGSTSTFTQKELLEVGNLNVIKSLGNLDPSFRIMENLEFGSDPNRLPDIQLRGQTGLPDLNNEYGTNPNLPLFILDGFETNLQRVVDLDIYMVKSITILKDASSKAVYGSRAANGVVVIETVRPPAGKLQITYNYNLNVELPDLTSYNLANPLQKYEIERMTDSRLTIRDGSITSTQSVLREYDAKLEDIMRGVNTYWLSQPLRNGFGQRHSVSLGGGRDELRYSTEMSYNRVVGVMEGSDRAVYGGGINLSYRKNKVSVNNILRLNSTRGDNSPYGTFRNFAEQNPYIRLRNADGQFNFNSPMHNGTVGVQDFGTERSITNNTELVWNIQPYLRVNGRLGLTSTNRHTDLFLPAAHNSFPQPGSAYDPEMLLRGSYKKSNVSSNRMNTTVSLNFNKAFDAHTIFANAGMDANSSAQESFGFEVVGFPNADLDFPAAAVQYAPNSRLSGTENKTRDIGFFSAVNYAYDDRYLADFSWRITRSSQFGSDSPTANFWSAGLGWNIHRESFMKDNGIFNTLRITANTGFTGSQPVDAYLGYPVYRYQMDNLYYGQYTLELVAMANPLLGAQRKHDSNISLNMVFLNNRLNLSADYYVANTDGLLIDINLPNSTGFSSFKANQGKVENRGIDGRVNYQLYRNSTKGDFVSLNATLGHNRNQLKELSNTLIALTSSQDNVMSSALKQRFEVGSSLNAIWAVPSKGIDPSTGREVFQKKDGSLTYDWDAADQIAAGDATAKLYGNFGVGVRFSGWQLNASFAYNWGGDKYNTTLLNKVEKIDRSKNVDARVFTSRWKQPGDVTFFKGINDLGTTYPTTRFVEKWNELTLANLNLSYDLDRLDIFKRMDIRRLRAALVMNNAAVLSTVGIERGIDYPFARTFSFTLQTNF